MNLKPIKPKLLVVLNYYSPYISGLSEYARLVAESLKEEYEVTVLTGKHDPTLPSIEMMSGIKVMRARPLMFLHKSYISLDFLLKYFKLSRSSDLVQLHLPMLEGGLLAYSTPRSIPIISTYHCDVTPGKGLFDKLATWAVKLSCRICLSRSRKVVVSSRDYALGSAVLGHFQNKWVEIFPPSKQIDGKSAPNGPAPGNASMRVGFLGRFVSEKGIDVLLDAVPPVVRQFPDAKFLLAGDFEKVAGGSIYASIKRKVDSLGRNVKVLGRLEETQLPEFYHSLDLFVLPSVNSYEAFGMVQVEAMRAGVQVIATDRRGVRVPVQKTSNGMLVPPGDSGALAEAIISCLHNVDRINRDEIAYRADSIFSNRRAFSDYKQLYQSVSD